MPFAAGISEHPIASLAVGEAVGEVMEKMGEGADLVTLFVTQPHAGALEDIAAAVHTLLDPKVLIGCAAESVVGNGREVEGTPAISVWAGNVGPVAPLRLEVVDIPGGKQALAGWPIDLPYVPAAAVIVGDPFSFPAESLFSVLNQAGGFPRVLGGMASGAQRAGATRLILDGEVITSGAVGVLIGASNEVWLEPVVSQGCHPVGRAYAVTRAEGNVVLELGGKPAVQRVREMIQNDLSKEQVEAIESGLLVGRVVNEQKERFGPGDFLVRTVLDVDNGTGGVTVGEHIEVGTTLQFHIRDKMAADRDLDEMLFGRSADGVLLFTCSGRGSAMFDEPDHDAHAVAELLDQPPTAGFFAAGEFGPLGDRNFVHGFTAAMGLFTDRSG